MAALIVGTVLALGALAYVLWPLIAAEGSSPRPSQPPVPLAATANQHREAGAAQQTADAVAAMREREDLVDDPVEAEIRRARAQLRSCPTCGPRPEPAARYCSRCGAALT